MKKITLEAVMRRAWEKFAEEMTYDHSTDSFCVKTGEVNAERRNRLRELLAIIDASPHRSFTDEELLFLSWKYYETPDTIKIMIEARPARLAAKEKQQTQTQTQ